MSATDRIGCAHAYVWHLQRQMLSHKHTCTRICSMGSNPHSTPYPWAPATVASMLACPCTPYNVHTHVCV